MDTLDGGFRCNMVSALEESIWRDRREHGCASPAAAKVGVGRLLQRLRDLRARMQLGPLDLSSDWSGGDPDKRF